LGHLRRPLRAVHHEPTPRTVSKSGNNPFERSSPALSGRTSERIVPETFYQPSRKLSIAAPADYREIALIAVKIQDGRIGKMPESGDPGIDLFSGQVIFFPNDLDAAGFVKKSQGQGGKGRQKRHALRNIATLRGFIVYI
jgi:hypothetical protein